MKDCDFPHCPSYEKNEFALETMISISMIGCFKLYVTSMVITMSTLKEQLYGLCEEYISKREAEIKRAILEVRESANNETKSSAGDKYETSREVMQQEENMNMARLNELKKLKATLEQISPTQKGDSVVPGSLVYTNNGNFYISISAGQLKVDGVAYYAISAASPVGIKLVGQKTGGSFELNGKRFLVEKVV